MKNYTSDIKNYLINLFPHKKQTMIRINVTYKNYSSRTIIIRAEEQAESLVKRDQNICCVKLPLELKSEGELKTAYL